MLTLHKPKYQYYDITKIGNSLESHLHWKKYFQKNPLNFRIYEDFEADIEIDNSNVGKKTTNIYKQSPVLNGYHLESELDDILKSGFYESHLGYDKVDWFVIEVIKIEKNGFLF